MKTDVILDFFKENGYHIYISNIPIIQIYTKNNYEEDSINVVIFVDSCMGNFVTKDALDNIAFQMERKYLLSGIAKVNILGIVLSDNIERDKSLSEGKTKFWILDKLADRVVIYESQPTDFDNLKQKLDVLCTKEYEMNSQNKNDLIGICKTKVKKIPVISISILIINLIVFAMMTVNGDTTDAVYMLNNGAMNYEKIFVKHEYYRFFTCMFMHFGFEHLLSNMVSLIMIGNEVEKTFGKLKFICIYILSGIFGSFISILYYSLVMENVISAGASGAIYGLMGAVFIKIIMNRNGRDGVLGKICLVFILLFMAGRTSGNVDNLAHLGGLVGGMIISFCFYHFGKIKNKNGGINQ